MNRLSRQIIVAIATLLAVVIFPEFFKSSDVLYGFSLVFFPGLVFYGLTKLFKL